MTRTAWITLAQVVAIGLVVLVGGGALLIGALIVLAPAITMLIDGVFLLLAAVMMSAMLPILWPALLLKPWLGNWAPYPVFLAWFLLPFVAAFVVGRLNRPTRPRQAERDS